MRELEEYILANNSSSFSWEATVTNITVEGDVGDEDGALSQTVAFEWVGS